MDLAMQILAEDVSRKILSKEIDKHEAMRLFQSLDQEAQSRVVENIRSSGGSMASLSRGDGKPSSAGRTL